MPVFDQVRYLIKDRHVEILGSPEAGCRWILVDDTDDLNRADLMEYIKEGRSPTTRSDDGDSHQRQRGSLCSPLRLGS